MAELPAAIDELTRVLSRTAVLDDLARRLAAGDAVHCLVFDVDNFDSMNALLGWETADEILVQVAATIAEVLSDFAVGRFAGDQFLAIGDHAPSEESCTSLTALAVDTAVGTHTVLLSAGQTSAALSGSVVNDVLRDSFAALRTAKAQGKQRVVVATSELRSSEVSRRRIASDALSALENNELVAWAQPIFDLTTNRPAGFELLARWPHPEGDQAPGQFIPIIESLGFSYLLGEFMVREAISLLARLEELGHTDTFVTMNISAHHFSEPLFASLIAMQLQRRSINPDRLVVELTESQRLPDSQAGRTAVDRLRSLGIGVASDDVGAGWSTLTQMIQGNFTHMKTDRALITATAAPGGAELITAIRMVAEGAGQIAIAEGIETETELDAVRKAGFTLGQGWLMQRPTSVEKALALLD